MKRLFACLIAAVLTLGLAACHAPDRATANNRTAQMQLKLYHVPAQQSAAIERTLHSALAGNNLGNIVKDRDNSMRVTEPFPGAVLVLAPAQMQDSIASAIKELAKASPKTAANVPIRVHFWVVQAKAGDGADAPALRPLEPTLKQLRASLGPSHFVLNEAVSAIANATDHFNPDASGQVSTSQHHDFQFSCLSTANGDIKLRVDYRDQSRRTMPSLHTVTTIRPGEYVVLAQAPSTDDTASGSDKTLMNLLVVRVDRLNPPHA